MGFGWRVWWLLGLGVLAGCVRSAPPANPETPWTPPADRSTGKTADAAWRAGATLPADPAQPQSLADLTDLALSNSPSTRQAWHNARQARALVDQAYGYLLPTLTATGGPSRQVVNAQPSGSDLNYADTGAGLQLNYLLINFGGGRRAAIEQALQTVYAANHSFNQSLQDVLLQIEVAYYNVIIAEGRVAAAKATLEDATAVLDAARAKLDAKLGTALDVLQAQASFDQANFRLAEAEGNLSSTQANLAQAAGLPGDTQLMVRQPAEALPSVPAPVDLARLINDAIGQRPDIAAWRADLAAKEAAVTVQSSALWPSLYLNGGVGGNDFHPYGSRDQGLSDRQFAYGLGLSVQWTIFDGWQTQAATRAAKEAAEVTRAQLRQAELAVSAEVWRDYYDLVTALRKARFSDAYLASTTAAYDLADESYRAGLNSLLDLLVVQSSLADARSQQVTSRNEVFTAFATLAHAVGRLEKGRPNRFPVPVSTPSPATRTKGPRP